MKKILEVLQYGDHDIRFNTDFSPENDLEEIPLIICKVGTAMVTTLWGGNELAVLAMIRALAVADLAVSVNRKDMVKSLDEQSALIAKCMREAQKEMERNGAVIHTFPPGVCPTKTPS